MSEQKLSARQKAARKGARTRKANAASMKRWLEIDKPAHEATVAIVNEHLKRVSGVRVRFNPRNSGLRLYKGNGMGTLCKVLGTGLTWRVLIDGYSAARDYHAGFWELAPPSTTEKGGES